ncbi:hypothetical protein AAVH_19432 [Aphelenchoides avenae]|nr:hypothetical protein AAVH_19432 [Aphelenchus avenae]
MSACVIAATETFSESYHAPAVVKKSSSLGESSDECVSSSDEKDAVEMDEAQLLRQAVKRLAALRQKLTTTTSWQKRADSTCSCGGVYTNNAMESAHRLSNHLVKIGDIGRYPKGCVCCPAGRPVKAAEMRERMFRGRVSAGEVSPHKNYFVYARGKLGREHVYIGTKDVCAVGNGSASALRLNSTVEYYEDVRYVPALKWLVD